MELYNLLTNHMTECLGLEGTPYFAWKIRTDLPDTVQKSYHIIVRSEEETVWDSGVIESGKTSFVTYAGRPLSSSTRYSWEVEVTDNHGGTAAARLTPEGTLLIRLAVPLDR